MPSAVSGSRKARAAFARLEVWAPEPRSAELVVAEAIEAGAVGLEEREGKGGVILLLYAPAARAGALRRALAERCGSRVRIGTPVAVPELNWSEAWKAGLEAVVVSPRLRVRPSFLGASPAPGRAELVIDPGQAFGTGGHPSTLLALEWIDALAPQLARGARVLDVGTGSGILALAALRLGAARAVALDLDPLAGAAARENAVANGLADRIDVFTGPIQALRPVPFDLVLANLLGSELLPLAPAVAARTARGGRAIFSGLLARECDDLTLALGAAGLRRLDLRHRDDTDGVRWASLLMTR